MKIYVYSLRADGSVRESLGYLPNHRNVESDVSVATLADGHKMIVSSRASTIHNNTMWSNTAKKGVYVEKMLEVLLQRRDEHMDRVRVLDRKIAKLKNWRMPYERCRV